MGFVLHSLHRNGRKAAPDWGLESWLLMRLIGFPNEAKLKKDARKKCGKERRGLNGRKYKRLKSIASAVISGIYRRDKHARHENQSARSHQQEKTRCKDSQSSRPSPA